MSSATLICQPAYAFTWSAWSEFGNSSSPRQPNDILLVRCQIGTIPRRQTAFYALLTAAEQRRANRFRQEADRQRFVIGRGGVRWLTALLINQSPDCIQLTTGQFGKPELVSADNWQMNVSHAGEWVLWAFTKQPVGIDVEQQKSGFAYHDLIDACLSSAEKAALQQTGERGDIAHQHLFYTLWTRKEAMLKATGIGLTNQLTSFSVLNGTQIALSSLVGASGTWHIRSFSLTDTYPMALACQHPGLIHGFTLIDSSNGEVDT